MVRSILYRLEKNKKLVMVVCFFFHCVIGVLSHEWGELVVNIIT